MKRFSGVWATFEYLDEMTSAITAVRKKGYQPTTFSPCPRHEIDHALGDPQSKLPFITLFFASLGTLSGYSFTAWTASDWVLPVGGKPILAIAPSTIIGYELTILFAAISSAIGMVVLSIIHMRKNPIPKAARQYTRFQRDRFGVLVPCNASQVQEFSELLKLCGAEEVHFEKA